MKFNAFSLATDKPWLKKILLVMKLTAFMMFIVLLQVSAKGFSQKVNLSETKTPLKKVLQQINKQTGFVFFYDSQDVRNKSVTINIKDATLEEALAQCLKNQSLAYKIINNTVVLQQKDLVVTDKTTGQAVSITITGQVNDNNNQPLPSVTVRLKDAPMATITDVTGKFSIEVPDSKSVLVFTYVGFIRKELTVSPGVAMQVTLTPDLSGLNEVVVVGYGTQKKVDLTGSVSTVSGEALNERSTPNAANLLQGRVPGLDVIQSSGQPGQDAPNFQVRGLGSFGSGAAPLILVDGIIVDNLNFIAGNDIESISVLKDAASAAIYGNRAANGVILVTTKRGKAGVTTINYNNDFSLNQPSRLPSLIYNSSEYMTDFNLAREHSNQTDIYTQAQINAYKNAPANSLLFPNFDYIKHYISNSFSQNHHISVNGGSEATTYNLSASYLNQDGIIKNTNANRYNLLFSIDSKVNKTFKVGSTITFTKQDIVEPTLSNDNLLLLIYQSAPTYAPFLPDGSGRIASNDYYDPNGIFGAGHNRSTEYILDNGNVTTNNYDARAQVYLETNITKGLTWLVKGAFNYDDSYQRTYGYAGAEYYYQPTSPGVYQLADNGNPPSLGIKNYDQRTLYLNAYTTLNYTHTFSKAHHINALLGYSVESNDYQFLYGERSQFPVTTLTQLNAGSVTGQNLAGDETQYALQSFFGRINYDYKNKYLLELNGRVDGTSRISSANRYGFFPSASVAWRVSQEDFMKSVTWLDNLKARASYGRLGNQNIGVYPYQALLSVTQYAYNTTSGVSQGVYQPNLNDPDIKWETTDVTDAGIDLDIHHGIFSLTADYYNKKTSGILFQPQVLLAVGLGAPTENEGTVQNRGFDLDLGHANNIGKDFRYSINVIFNINKNKLLQLAGGTQDLGLYINQVGQPIGSFYMTKWVGIFQSTAEIASSPTQQYAPKAGDLKYQDINGDNKIDANDRQIVSGIFPNYTYSFKLNLGYKNFDLTTFFQGVQGIKHYVNAWGVDPFLQGSPPPTVFRDAWTPENHSETVPALYTYGYGPVDGINSTYFLKDASYLRLKNIRLTYHLTDQLAKKLLMKKASVFVSSDNLFTFTKYPGDPERLQSGGLYNAVTNSYGQTASGSEVSSGTRYAQYPQVRMFTAGLNVSF